MTPLFEPMKTLPSAADGMPSCQPPRASATCQSFAPVFRSYAITRSAVSLPTYTRPSATAGVPSLIVAPDIGAAHTR
jgi:hypothetical protein